ncbi:MAG: FkbM family methyltransferase [Verrucomicrobiaceae bacterium]
MEIQSHSLFRNMKRWLARWLGLESKIRSLSCRLMEAKARATSAKEEVTKLRGERNRLRNLLRAAEANIQHTASVRHLVLAPHVPLTKEHLAQIIREDCQATFSQNGEDRVISSILEREGGPKGVMVDIGAYHPSRYSNTFLFHLRGWPCVNVDANEDSIALFQQVRPTDTNLRALVSDRTESRTYYHYAEGAWNTADAEAAQRLMTRNNASTMVTATTELQTRPLMDILDEHVAGKKFDVLDIDVEGMDAKLVLSMDFSRHAPLVILAEISKVAIKDAALTAHLAEGGYKLHGYCGPTAFFLRET